MSTVKCLVWDLDNTLWKGVLLEDGEVHLREEIRRVVAGLDERGILQAVASRNDHDHAWAWVEKLGIAEHIVLPEIGWGPKSASVKAIAEKLQFTLATVAFIDDTAMERAEVAHHLPEVRCYPAEMAEQLLGLPEFTPATVTEHSRRRRHMYQAGFAREAARTEFTGADEEFLRSAGLEMHIRRANEADLARVEELTLRTSQMNATGVHYSDETLRGLLSDVDHEVLVVSMTDRFGPHGAVGIVLLAKHPEVWHLKLLATSCRVVAFGAGAVLLNWLTDQAASAGVNLVADFRRTDRNRMMEVAYRFAGFGDEPVEGAGVLPPAAEGVERLGLRPARSGAPTTMTVHAVRLTVPEHDLAARGCPVTTLYQWFADSADRTPAAPALEIGEDVLTYGGLRDRVDAVATLILAANGGRVPKRVALLASRSLTAFAGYLAVLRLGAVVVPLNPGHPVHRNELICGSVELDVVVADDNGAEQVAALGVGAVVALSDDDVRAAGAGALPDLVVGPDDTAYILFTSGSTGTPKGVPITHANLGAYVAHNIARFDVGPGCRVSHTFDFTFDPSVFDLFVTWGGGATLVCPHRTELLYPVDYLVDKAITHWFSVPSVVSVSANLGNLPTGRPTVLRQSIFIGEQLTRHQAAAWRAVAPQAHIDNVYGPTELTVACTEYRLPDDPGHWPSTSNDTVPIGSVYEFLDYVILDEDGHLAGAGELCVRGVQRFTGYLDPGHNAGRFVVKDGDRYVPYEETEPRPEFYYRTGDFVRWENGELVHHSRLDHQLKIRGYRVELGEIEATIARHDGVTQALVVTVPGEDAPELIGFYTGTEVPVRSFVRWLRQYLPLYMVPRRLSHLAELPLNANGKVDRGALRESVLAGTN